MATGIYQISGVGYNGSHAMAYLVAIGAHDGHGGMGGAFRPRKVDPRIGLQGESWFSPASPLMFDKNPVVGQIFFPTADATLDKRDLKVLDAVAAWYRYQRSLLTRVEVELIGNADARGAAKYNELLGSGRAEAVKKYLDRKMECGLEGPCRRPVYGSYRSKASTLGERNATGNAAFDRRVDIVLRSVSETRVDMGPVLITAKNTGPLTKKILVRNWGGVGAPTPIPFVGVDVLEIEIKNPNTGASAFYVYAGGNFGWNPKFAPGSISRPVSDYTDVEIPFGFVDVDDFEGAGSISGIMAGYGGQCLVFSGPKLAQSTRVLKKSGVEFCGLGWDIQVGASVGVGHWQRQPYRTDQERTAYLAEQAKRHRERESRGPKY